MTRKSTPSPRPAPIPADVTVVFYSVHLAELEEWIGSGSEPRFQEAWAVVRDAEEGDWEPQELAVLERLLRRLILEGKHYPGLQPDEQYYLTQLLIDLLDEYVDQDALTEEIPLARLLTTWHEAPAAARP
ncbi:MAG: hypothetical protein FJX77_12505, partial [Armatimonadetes bacterium]|nr:hypothetical protein [Armatimonadota bacterium]